MTWPTQSCSKNINAANNDSNHLSRNTKSGFTFLILLPSDVPPTYLMYYHCWTRTSRKCKSRPSLPHPGKLLSMRLPTGTPRFDFTGRSKPKSAGNRSKLSLEPGSGFGSNLHRLRIEMEWLTRIKKNIFQIVKSFFQH